MLRALAKLRGRSLSELRERAAQAVAKRVERLRDAAEISDANLWTALRPIPNEEAWLMHFATRDAPQLFAGFHSPDETAAALRRVDPEYVNAAITRADAALSGRFDLLGYRDLSFGWPIDWHLDPVAGVRAPLRHWSTIPYLDTHLVGDHKIVWELNRHQWLVDIGAAWWLTGDVRYGRALVALLNEWMDANPPKLGVNWASSLEVALRAVSWIWALEFVRRSDVLDARTLKRLTKHLIVHGRHLERYLSTYFSPNTHLTGEALGLFYLGTYFPELQEAARWRDHGTAVLLEQLPRHILRDGVYCEQSVHYQRYTIEFLAHLWLLDEANGGTLGVELAPQVDALLEYVQCLTRGDGSVPLLGDEDGGRLFFLDARPLDDLRGLLALGAVLCERPDFAFVAGAPTAQLVWLAGPAAVDRFQTLGKTQPPYASRGFEEGGSYVMRDGWGSDANHLVIDCGPHGFLNCGHAHADALAFELALRGRPVLVDPGTFTYTTDAALRDAFRSTLAHNAASVDGAGSSEPNGPFHWRRTASARVLAWRTQPDGRTAYFEGTHNGFEQLPSPVRYRRAVEFNTRSDGVILIRDTFECRGTHTAILTFQCAADIQVERATTTRLDLFRAGEVICRLEMTDARGSFELEDAWISRSYGARQPAVRCRFIAPLAAGANVFTTAIRLAPWSANERSAQPALTETR